MKTKKFLIRMDNETHSAIQMLAKLKYESINSILNIAIKEYCNRNYEKMISNREPGTADCQQAVHHVFKKDSDQKHNKRKN
ncbi:MAG: hypothetical protein RBQ97_12105 [Acholeplasma sp.]|nr:hypothetical protein [Acholeplasma sp.]